MSILDRVTKIEQKVDAIEQKVSLQDERIDGRGGLVKVVGDLAEDVRSVKRALWTVAGGIVIASVGFAFTVLQVVHP